MNAVIYEFTETQFRFGHHHPATPHRAPTLAKRLECGPPRPLQCRGHSCSQILTHRPIGIRSARGRAHSEGPAPLQRAPEKAKLLDGPPRGAVQQNNLFCSGSRVLLSDFAPSAKALSVYKHYANSCCGAVLDIVVPIMRASVLIIVLLLLGCRSPDRASVKIHAIGPIGETFWTAPQPIWRFAITNTSDAIVLWKAGVEINGKNRDYSIAGGFIDWPEGILQPKQTLLTNMIVPATTNGWRGSIDYWTVSLADVREAESNANRFGGGKSAAEWCRHVERDKATDKDEWHH